MEKIQILSKIVYKENKLNIVGIGFVNNYFGLIKISNTIFKLELKPIFGLKILKVCDFYMTVENKQLFLKLEWMQSPKIQNVVVFEFEKQYNIFWYKISIFLNTKTFL